MLRMRLAFGVGIKADLLACLSASTSASNQHAGGLTVADLAQILSYSKNATRQALDEMVRADVVVRIDGRPSRHLLGNLYFRPFDRNAPTDEEACIPCWGYWAQVLAILTACDRLLGDKQLHELPEVVQTSRLRDLAEKFGGYWSWFGARSVDAQEYPGAEFFDGFAPVLGTVMDWARKRV